MHISQEQMSKNQGSLQKTFIDTKQFLRSINFSVNYKNTQLYTQQEIFGGKYVSETWDSYGEIRFDTTQEIRGNVLQGNTFLTRGKKVVGYVGYTHLIRCLHVGKSSQIRRIHSPYTLLTRWKKGSYTQEIHLW